MTKGLKNCSAYLVTVTNPALWRGRMKTMAAQRQRSQILLSLAQQNVSTMRKLENLTDLTLDIFFRNSLSLIILFFFSVHSGRQQSLECI